MDSSASYTFKSTLQGRSLFVEGTEKNIYSHAAPFPTALIIGAAKDIVDIEAQDNMVMFRYTTYTGKRAFLCASHEEAKEAATRLHENICILRDGEDQAPVTHVEYEVPLALKLKDWDITDCDRSRKE